MSRVFGIHGKVSIFESSNAGGAFRLFCGFSLGTLEEVDFVFLPDRQSRVTIESCPEFSGPADKFQFLSVFWILRLLLRRGKRGGFCSPSG